MWVCMSAGLSVGAAAGVRGCRCQCGCMGVHGCGVRNVGFGLCTCFRIEDTCLHCQAALIVCAGWPRVCR